MKCYYQANCIRFVGKVSEVRSLLKTWSKQTITVKDYLHQKGH
ncbi:Z-ring formation inhibitor MciZ [Ammoniphilus resinae]